MEERRVLQQEEVHQYLYQIMQFFANICEQNALKYSMAYGTLLGAVRHQDFIPWDDDVDMIMPRDDYEKLYRILTDGQYGKYQLMQTSYWPFMKVIDNTTFVEPGCVRGDEHLWIDIFPVDGLPADEQKSKDILNKARRLGINHGRAAAIIGRGSTAFRSVAKLPALVIPKLRGVAYYTQQLDSLAKEYDFADSEYVADIVWTYGPRERMLRSSFDRIIRLPFHGGMFDALADWDGYLTQMYGDYRKLPPEKERAGHRIKAYVMKGQA